MAVRPAGPKSGGFKPAESLKESAKIATKSAKQGKVDAFAKVDSAAAQALKTTATFAETVADAGGVQGWVSDDMRAGGRYVAKGVSSGLSNIASTAARLLGDAHQPTVRELQRDPNAMRFSEKMFGKAGQQLQLSHDAMTVAWSSYVEAVKVLSVSGEGALHVASVADSLAKAAALTTSASATKMAEFGVKLSNAAAQAAEAKVPGARDLLVLSAKFSSATANVLANPEGAAPVKGQLAAYQADLQQVVSGHPGVQEHVKRLLAA